MKPSKPSEKTIVKNLKTLRKMIESEAVDDIEKRIAYSIETALRWVIEETTWGSDFPITEVYDEAKLLRKEVKGTK
jgi:hypothetical protein